MNNLIKSLAVFFLWIILTDGLSQNKNNDYNVSINGLSFKNGSILSLNEQNQLIEATIPYDNLVEGVFVDETVVSEGVYPIRKKILKEGISTLRYNNEGGTIKKGDLLTTSSSSGEVMKALKSGMVVAIALEDASKEFGLIKCRIIIQYVNQ